MILVIIFTIISVLYDKGKRFTNHIPRFIFRAVSVILISYFTEGNFIINFAQNTAIFYLLFDYALNIFEGRAWNHTGSTSIIDKMTNKYGSWKIQFLFKILFIIVTFVLKFKII